MCGFVGVLQPASQGPVDEGVLRELLASIRHRGPDQEGVFVRDGFGVAACRLAIRGGPEGDQPLIADDDETVIVFNGELFSAPDTVAGFSATESDARRLLTLHERTRGGQDPEEVWGDAAALAVFHVLREGMGSAAVYDRRAGYLRLWHDSLGIKPLYTVEPIDDETEAFWFASELTPLLRAVPATRELNPAGMAELLHYQRPVLHLPFQGIGDERGDCSGGYHQEGVTEAGFLTRDLTCSESDEEAVTFLAALEDPVAVLRATWQHAARQAADVDGPVSLFLSGGLDSSAAAAWCGRDDILCLTGRFAPHGGELDESELAAAVAAQHGLAHEIVDLRDEDLITDLPEVIRALEVPMMGPGSLSMWRMAKRAAEHGKVVLTGTGGDELFGGYARSALVLGRAGPWTRGYEPLRARIEAAGADPAARMRAAMSRFDDLEPVMDRAFLRTLPDPEPFDYLACAGGNAELQVHIAERKGTLGALLHVEDRVTMAHGLEGRPVSCLGGLLEVAQRMPSEWLIGPDGEGKRVLRAALEGHVPESVRLNPRKRGFPTPFARAARTVGRDWVLDLMHDRRFIERGWWNVEACRALLDEERPLYDRALWMVCSWEIWARLFLDGDAFSEEPPAE